MNLILASIGSDLRALLSTIDNNKTAIKTATMPDSIKGPTIGRLSDAQLKIVALQKIVQPAGHNWNDPVLYSYAFNIQGLMSDTIPMLMDTRTRIMGTVGNQTGPGGKSVPGNVNARAHYDLLTVTITRAETVLVKGGHCYLNFGK